MKKFVLFFVVFFLVALSTYSSNNLELEGALLSKLEQISTDKYKQLGVLKSVLEYLGKTNYGDIKKVVESVIKIKVFEIEKDEKEVKEILVGTTSTGREIKAYYRGNSKGSFLLFVANIHGSYEYGTYETAKLLKEKLIASNKKGWMIIETLNPDGLQVYLNSDRKDDFYLEGRANVNNIDLNRNFCTKSFIKSNYVRGNVKFQTGETCGQEREVSAIENLFKSYSFSGLIDIHSEGGILFIPENSFEDENVISFANRIKNLLGEDYFFEVDYETARQKEELIKIFDIDSGGEGEFTGTLITYFYELTGAPAVLLELQEHGEIGKEVLNLVEMIK